MQIAIKYAVDVIIPISGDMPLNILKVYFRNIIMLSAMRIWYMISGW